MHLQRLHGPSKATMMFSKGVALQHGGRPQLLQDQIEPRHTGHPLPQADLSRLHPQHAPLMSLPYQQCHLGLACLAPLLISAGSRACPA